MRLSPGNVSSYSASFSRASVTPRASRSSTRLMLRSPLPWDRLRLEARRPRLRLPPEPLAETLRQWFAGAIVDLRVPLARASVRIIHATLRDLLNAAVDEGIIAINPAERLGRHLRLVSPATARQEKIKVMTRKQLASFLGVSATAAKEYERRHYGLFLLLARTGMRLGEALALQWQDVDFPGREIRVARALSAGRIETPKSGHGRTVDMSDQLSGNLLRLQVTRKEEALKRGWGELPAWVFCTEEKQNRPLPLSWKWPIRLVGRQGLEPWTR
jgi:integrase